MDGVMTVDVKGEGGAVSVGGVTTMEGLVGWMKDGGLVVETGLKF